jgi:hypothetical protein
MRKLCCGQCDFEAETGEALMTHMVATQHGLDIEVAAEVMDGGGFADLAKAFEMIAADPTGENFPPGMERPRVVDLDDPDLPEEVREWVEKNLKENG